LRLLNAMRQCTEGMTEVDINGKRWATICTANIVLDGITPAQKPGYLSALEKLGFYRKVDKYFGMVRL